MHGHGGIRWRLIALTCLTLVLATPSLCSAHAVHPVYFGLGPLALLIPFSEPSHLPKIVLHYLSIAGLIAIQALVLRCMISSKKAIGNLWRAVTAFVASKTAESVSCIAIVVVGQWVLPWLAWSLDSWETVYVVPLLVFGAGVIANYAIIWAVYRSKRPDRSRILLTASLLSTISYMGLLISTLVMMKARWV